MEMLRRLFRDGDAGCGCGHPVTVHWRHAEGSRMWCSAPGCDCSLEATAGTPRQEPDYGEGLRIVPSGPRRKSA